MRPQVPIATALFLAVLGCATAPQPGSRAGHREGMAMSRDAPESGLAALLLDATPPPPEEQEELWQLTHFHRLGSDDTLLKALEMALVEKKAGSGVPGALDHFFAAALSKRPAALGTLEARAAAAKSYAPPLASILRAAREFSSPAPVSREAVDALWAEYRARGEQSALAAIVDVLALAPTDENGGLVRHAALSLARNVPVHGNIAFLEQAWIAAAGRQRQQVRLVLDAVRRLQDDAGIHTARGDNLLREGKTSAAVEEYQEALRRYPAHHPAYTALGRHYERTGNVPLALRFTERALIFAGEDAYCLTNLGRTLYRLRRYPEALSAAERSLKADATNAYGHYLLGLIHQATGDRERAVSQLTRSLEVGPDDSCSGDARRRLAAMNAPPPENPADLLGLLRRREFDQIERHLAQLLESREKNEHGKSLLMNACDKLAVPPRNERAFAARLRELRAWLAARPDSHFALLCTGSCLVEYGYFGRGGGYAGSVTEQGWRVFRERLEAGRAHLESAFAINPSDPIAPRELIWAATGLSLGRDEVDRQLARAAVADPAFFEIQMSVLTYLLPRWHGSHEEMLEHARAAAAAAAPGSPVPRVLTQAHFMVYEDLVTARAGAAEYFRDPEVWREIRDVNVRILRDFPDSTQIRNWYARAAFLAGEHAVAREQFRLIGDAWYNVCWKSRNDFEEARRSVFASE